MAIEIRELAVDDLVLDQNLNLRDKLDEPTVERYAEAWGRIPPITVFEVDGRWLLTDGFHRYAAAVALRRRTIAAEVRVGSFNDALDFAAGANLYHGLPLSRAERRRAVEVKLRLHHEWSDRRLAEELGVHRDLVGKVRRQLVEAGQVPAHAGRVGADGKTYPASLPKDPNERLPRGKAHSEPEDPRDRGSRESDAPPWDDTTDPLPAPAAKSGRSEIGSPPWDEGADARTIAASGPVAVATPTIDEMLTMMARQVMEVVSWTQAEGFAEAYRGASANSRGLFHTAAIRLAARAETLRKG
ncbi:MAG TPA: ParB/RepB/Spo0J family partition protein [Isosphaeraceae bacterium]|jgi:ParB-like chromosome segregation protein Spo0J|nr:ParB/RepB/Spo0J family partition protein [Isosphaeraceae bacterium]